MKHHPLPRAWKRWTPLAAAILGSAAVAAPASAAIRAPVIAAPHAFDITYNTSDIFLGDFPEGAHTVTVTRDGTVVAEAAATLVKDATGVVEGGINNGHAAATDCWTGFTPQLLAGDLVTVAGPDGTDSQEIAGVETQEVVQEGDALVVRGTAMDKDGAALDAASLDVQLHPPEGGRFSTGSSGNQFMSALNGDGGSSLTYDAATKTFEARWPNLGDGDRGLALAGAAQGNFTVEPLDENVNGVGGSIFEAGATPGPLAACSSVAFRPNAVTGADRDAINAASLGTDLVISGVSDPNVTGVAVKLGSLAAKTASISAGKWSATIPAAEVAGLADGTLVASATYTNADGSFHGVNKSFTKDTAAPGAPSANIGSGTYSSAQSVVLQAAEGTIRYTTDGSEPTASSPAYSSPINVAASQSIKAVAVDAAGNTSPASQFDYTIAAPQRPVVTPLVQPSVSLPKLKLESLTLSRRVKLRSARRVGISSIVYAPTGAKVARIRILRGKKVIQVISRKVARDGVLEVRLPSSSKARRSLKRGVYTIEIQVGQNAANLGKKTIRRVRIL